MRAGVSQRGPLRPADRAGAGAAAAAAAGAVVAVGAGAASGGAGAARVGLRAAGGAAAADGGGGGAEDVGGAPERVRAAGLLRARERGVRACAGGARVRRRGAGRAGLDRKST